VRAVHVDYPYGLDTEGRTATTEAAGHVRDLVEQLLFTEPGERVNRPELGCGLAQLVFEPNSGELSATVRAMVAGSLQRWLGDLIDVQVVETETDDSLLRVTIVYRLLLTGESVQEHFERDIA
jgi:phage baseplate assembly protein W